MTTLLTANRVVTGLQLFQHVAIANRSGAHVHARSAHRAVEAEVAHHRDDDRVVGQLAALTQLQCSQRDQPVAVDHATRVIDGNHPIPIAIERQSQVGLEAHHGRREVRRMRRAALVVDVAAVGRAVDHPHVGTQHPSDARRDDAHRTVRAVEHHVEATEASFREQRQQPRHVRIDQVDHVHRYICGRYVVATAHPCCFDAALDVIGELAATGRKQLDPVVVIRIVRRGDHRCRHIVGRADERQCRRWHHAGQRHRRAGGDEPGGERLLEHLTRLARVATDHPFAAAQN